MHQSSNSLSLEIFGEYRLLWMGIPYISVEDIMIPDFMLIPLVVVPNYVSLQVEDFQSAPVIGSGETIYIESARENFTPSSHRV